jgi:hypothetical protein
MSGSPVDQGCSGGLPLKSNDLLIPNLAAACRREDDIALYMRQGGFAMSL